MQTRVRNLMAQPAVTAGARFARTCCAGRPAAPQGE